MPNINKILLEKINRLNSVPEKFVSEALKSQKELQALIEGEILKLETEGNIILLNERNLSIINGLSSKIDNAVFNDEYIKSLTDFTREFKIQSNLNNTYFTEINVGFQDSDIYKTTLEATQKNALQLLGQDSFTQVVNAPISQMLQSSITNQSSYLDTIKSIREFIEGNNEVDGRLASHVKRIAFDSFSASDRTYTNTVANSLGLEFYRYQGGEMEDTRPFCDERAGKYFHKKEIEAWGAGNKCCGLSWPQSGKWQGRNSATNSATIFVFAGGYNCKHAIIPVSTRSVPKDVINRAIESGFYKQSA
jgi:hypothetical protein